MNNQKVQNPKKDMITDLLATEKNMNVNFAIALNETSNEILCQKLMECANQIRNAQRNLYELSFAKGWYTLEKAEIQKITEAYTEHQTCIEELSA